MAADEFEVVETEIAPGKVKGELDREVGMLSKLNGLGCIYEVHQGVYLPLAGKISLVVIRTADGPADQWKARTKCTKYTANGGPVKAAAPLWRHVMHKLVDEIGEDIQAELN